MAKLTLSDLTNLANEQTVVSTINANNTAIETAMEKTLSRDGTTPNTMSADLDMNSNQILNLPDATTDQEPVTLGQLNDLIIAEGNASPLASYVVIATDSTLSAERVLTAGSGITIVDGGAGSTVTISSAAGGSEFADDVFRIQDDADDTKEIAFQASGITTGTTRTITVPDADLTMAGIATTQTLTNKTINLASNTLTGTTAEFNTALSDGNFATQAGTETLTNKTLTTPTITVLDNVFTVQDNADATKQLQFQLSGITTGNTRTITIPDQSSTLVVIAGNQTLTGGFAATSIDDGTKSSGTFTPTFVGGNIRRYINGGAHTLAPPTGEGTMIIQVTNNGSAGTITTSGFSKVTGDAISTTNGDDFHFFITHINAFSHLHVQALQ